MSSPSPLPAADLPEGSPFDPDEAAHLADHFESEPPVALLRWALDRFGPQRFALVSSFQAEALVLIDMASRLHPDVRVITIDTGRLPEATYGLIDRVRERYGITVETIAPETELLEAMVQKHGVNLFYRSVELRRLCCHVRKVRPLARALQTVSAWATGLRRDQAVTRAGIRKVALDREHGGILKLCPLADWTWEDVWAYIREHDLPYHPLYDEGYRSIGCAPCTRPVAEGEDDRSGRWWWEAETHKECGLHLPGGRGPVEQEVDALLAAAAASPLRRPFPEPTR